MKKNNNIYFLAFIFLAVCLSIVLMTCYHGVVPADNFGNFGCDSDKYESCVADNARDDSVIVSSKKESNSNQKDFSKYCSDIIFGEKPQPLQEKVYIGGNALGLSFDGEGAVVIGMNEFLSKEGIVSPAVLTGINIGDRIKELNGVSICNSAVLSQQLQLIKEKTVKIIIKRGTLTLEKDITPKFDIVSKTYKLGLWIKDANSGIGTLTFCRSNGGFGSLGHPVTDSKTGQIVKVDGGNVYNCQILSIEKGERGKAGELRGTIENENRIGSIIDNNNYGVYGILDKPVKYYSEKMFEIASTKMVTSGKAQLICTLDGTSAKAYDIEIIKATNQSGINDKGLVIRVTDPKLLELTGGIVQGMSGSPIIQNGRLVGAVTHVFVNDPTKGYGIYAEWMYATLINLQNN